MTTQRNISLKKKNRRRKKMVKGHKLKKNKIRRVTGRTKEAAVSVLFSETIKAVHELNIMYG